MKKTYFFSTFITMLLLITTSSFSQVGIGTTSPADGAILDINSADKGVLISRIELTSTLDTTTVPSLTEGLLIYNTVTSGTLPFQVTPGFYYWQGSQWVRFYNRGYGIKFDQTAETTASNSNTTYTQISGLDSGLINVPYSGTYQIKIEASYACGNLSNVSSDGTGQASVSLNMTIGSSGSPVRVKEKYVYSSSKRIGGTTLNNLPQNTTIIYTVDLDVQNQYRFNATGREWSKDNVDTGTFGKDTSGYPGSNGQNDALRGSLSITLLRQQ